jgi:hypothetical protein
VLKRVGAWTVAIVIALMALGLYVQGRRLRAAELRERTERAAKQDAALEAADWKRAAELSQTELAESLPRLKGELDVAKAEQARLLMAASFEGKSDATPVLCVSSTATTPPTGGPYSIAALTTTEGASSSPFVSVATHVRLQEAVVADELGGIYVKRDVQSALSIGEDWFSGWKPVVGSDLEVEKASVDPELTDALAAWRSPKPPRIDLSFRPPGLWRGGWSCVAGGGVTLTGAPAAGVFCGVGPQF